MAHAEDLTDQRFTKLVAVRRAPNNKYNRAMWVCQCDCGNEVTVSANHLKKNNTKSCGCLNHVKKLPDVDWDDPISRNVRRRELYAGKVVAGYKRIRTPEHRAKNNKREKERYQENLEESRRRGRKRSQAYHERHPDARSAIYNRRRAAILGSPRNDLTAAQWRAIKTAYGHRCVYCGRKMQRLSQDHLIPLSKGGAHTASNIVPACISCNCRKATGPVLVPVQLLLLL